MKNLIFKYIIYKADEFIKEAVMKQNSLDFIRSFGFSNEEINQATHVSLQTIENQASRKLASGRNSAPEAKIDAFYFAVVELAKQFTGASLKKEVQQLKIDHTPFSEFIDTKVDASTDSELLKTAIRLSVELRLKETTNDRAEDLFRKKYEYVNPETLELASKESPDLVQGILGDEKSDPLMRSFALMALAQTGNDQYIPVLKIYSQSDSPLIRESSFIGLYEFYDLAENRNLDLKKFFQERLLAERAPGVHTRIKSILEQM